jgi:hypothetical protein
MDRPQGAGTKIEHGGQPGERRRGSRFPSECPIGWLARAILVCLVATAPPARAADPLPIATNVILTAATPGASFSIDLGTLPNRPWLIVEATPDPAHADMQLEIEATNWQFQASHPGDNCPGPASSIFSPTSSGAAKLSFSLIHCDPLIGALAGETASILVRAIAFGTGSHPAAVSVVIRGETRPPTATLSQQVDTALTPRELSIVASKDTVIYEDDPDRSNGQGDFLWAGQRLSGLFTSYARRSLVAFELDGHIPPSAVVDYASLSLEVASVDPAESVHRIVIEPLATGTWDEGNADATGSEFIGTASTSPAADWEYRSRPTTPWVTPGGDPSDLPIVDVPIDLAGLWTFDEPLLREAVQSMVSDTSGDDGFMLSKPDPATETNEGVRIASRENLSGTTPPTLLVQFTPTEPFESGTVATNLVPFYNEGQNFRWIYDLDQDDIFVTNIGGVCEVVDTTNLRFLPYTYSYGGDPFTGVDCCTWKIDSPDTGTVGTGQALFFHNVDASNPANLPPDTDQDGIRDLCPSAPNGPLRGTCMIGLTIGPDCRSDQECPDGGVCNLAQEDTDENFQGNACPEPGLAAGLFVGLGLLTALTRARRPGSAT